MSKEIGRRLFVIELAKKDILGSWRKLKKERAVARMGAANAKAHNRVMHKIYDRLDAIRAGKAFPRHGEFGTTKMK